MQNTAPEKERKILKNIARVLLLLISALLIFSLIFWVYAEVQGYVGIQKIVNEIKANSTDQEALVKNLLKWEHENVDFSYAPLTGSINIDRILKVFVYSNRPNLIFYHKLGACGEFSTLFMEMAGIAGVQTRIAGTPGEDHQWNEVFINGKWMHVDSTLNPPDSFDHPHVYENEWRWNLSKVYAYYNDEQIDVTDAYYGKIGILNVTVNENNKPLENAEVIIASQFRMERDPDFYKAPQQTTFCTTVSNGTCSFYLGESNYTILVRKGDLPFRFSPYLLEFEKKNVTLRANATEELVFSLPETKLDPIRVMIYFMVGYLFIIGYFAKVKPDFRVYNGKNIKDLFLKALHRVRGNFNRYR